MKDYELFVESYNPCGGREHGQKEFLEVSTDDPGEFVKQHANVSEYEVVSEGDGEIVIQVNQHGYVKRYSFTEE